MTNCKNWDEEIFTCKPLKASDFSDCKNCKYTDEYCTSGGCEQVNHKSEDRFTYRIPVIKNNEFDGFVYVRLGDKIPELHGGHYGRPEQCTGLKDRNQKLIYEGDILDFDLSTPRNGGHYRGFIRWQKQNELIGWMISDMDMSGDWDLRQIAHPNDWMVWGEIIGNIHENEDLLENEE